ncbi:MAG: acyltransferase domain-containing protein, partial [Holophagales bacterium]|nr:acyltransferase domain-containing protein [Holophagales bacterium]
RAPSPAVPSAAALHAPERLALDFEDPEDLAARAKTALAALEANQPARWRALRARGVFRGGGAPAKAAFLYTGQGSQYLGMLGGLRETQPIVAETFREADRVMTPLIGQPLTELLYGPENGSGDAEAKKAAEHRLRQTEITQPAILTVDIALTRLLAAYGLEPDLVMGHSLGEYGALVAAGCLDFEQALLAVSSRGREMANVSVADNGLMAAVFAPLEEVERVLEHVDGYAVVANINSHNQAVIGGETAAVKKAVEAFTAAGHRAPFLPVSHAFHTRIVAPASEPLGRMLRTLDLRPPRVPLVGNVDGELYPMGGADEVVPQMLERLERQIASPVQFVKGLETLYREGARVFVEVGPKRALQGFVESVLGHDEGVLALYTNHPKTGDVASINQALCGLWASGLGAEAAEAVEDAPPAVTTESAAPAEPPAPEAPPPVPRSTAPDGGTPAGRAPDWGAQPAPVVSAPEPAGPLGAERERELGRIFAELIERGLSVYGGRPAAADPAEPVVITGAGLGLPGGRTVFDDRNVGRLLRGEQMIDSIPSRFRQAMVQKHITRLVKSDRGGPRFETIDSSHDVIKLAARGGALDLAEEFGFPSDRLPALDHVTQLAIGAGLDALRDAGIPLVMHYKTTTKGTFLPARWGLPEALRDDTGVIFASAFPGYDSFADYLAGYERDLARHERLGELETLRDRARAENASPTLVQELERRLAELRGQIDAEPYVFDRRFLFRVLSMGHSQFAELIGARGPNTQINAACASTTQAVALAEDWIRAGRCRRVVIVSADDVTSDRLLEWFAAGFLASGAAATDDAVEDAALPFDRRRHGMILGMGAAGMVVEEAAAAQERGLRPIAQVLSAVTANSAFHGSRLDVGHIREVMEKLVQQAEERWGVRRHDMAPQTVFVSHETYTPARGGSAQAEVDALRHVFGASADRMVMANTKGFTGHPMGVGLEDVVAVKALETGLVPPVANFKEIDPDLGELNLSRGGLYPVRYALRLGAGFGSQISLSLLRWVENPDGRRRTPEELGFAYRIDDELQGRHWLVAMGRHDAPEREIDRRVLRLRDQGPPARQVS